MLEIAKFAHPGRLLVPRGVFWAHGSSPLGPPRAAWGVFGVFLLHGAKPSPPEWVSKNSGGDEVPILRSHHFVLFRGIFSRKILVANEALRWFALILVSKIRLYLTESESNGGGAGKIRIDVAGAPFVP